MKKYPVIAFLLIICLLTSNLTVFGTSAADINKITGETSRNSKEITLADGTKTGVVHTQIYLSGYYGNNRVINVAEGDLSNKNLSLRIINSGSYMVSRKTMSQASADYTAAKEGETVVAAVNGDLYMTSIHSGSSVAKSVLSVPRGIIIADGEIWASAQIDQENLGATNIEKGQPAGLRPAFGITDLNQPVVGQPIITPYLDIGGTKITADGINRLPALDSIIVYNHRCNSTNYALNDSYEVEIEMDSGSALKAGKTITDTVKAIYESGSTVRPSLTDPNTVVLTARGSRIAELKNACAVGKAVSIKTELHDNFGRTELWQNVTDAIGGHMQVLNDGDGTPHPQQTYYPTTLIGYKDDGTVALVTVTSTLDNSRAALKQSQSYELCLELGYNSVFYLDGGGSTTFVTLEEGTYSPRNKCSDGYERAVIGGVGFVWNDTAVCPRQGSLHHINVYPDDSTVSPVHIDGALLNRKITICNYTQKTYSEENNSTVLEVTENSNDPFVFLDYTGLKAVDAKDYPYLVIKARTSASDNSTFAVYHSCGDYTGPGADRVKTKTVYSSDNWQYIMFNMGTDSLWSGTVNNLRLDFFNEQRNAGETMEIASVTLYKNATEVSNIRKGILPEGTVLFKDIIEDLKPTPDFIIGDVKEDGKINAQDIALMKKCLKGASTFSESQRYAADVNGSGTVNAVDSMRLRYRLTYGDWKK